jgi:predicted O-methyltransferase YrrM
MNTFVWSKHIKERLDGRPDGFVGRFYQKNAGKVWKPYIPMSDRPIRYLEIGVADGGNAIHVANSYCNHPDSKVYCVDPWMDYDEYDEYRGQQDKAWKTFNLNVTNSGHAHKFVVHRGVSDNVVPTFDDNFFDLILVDGNHETDFVYRDGVMALQKAKIGAYIVFDDYDPNGKVWPQTKQGVDQFVQEYSDKLEILGCNTVFQLIVKKLK